MERGGTSRWAAATVVAIIAAGALVAVMAPRTVPGYDTSFTLAWGRDLARGLGLDFTHPSSPTPHPLALIAGLGAGFMPVTVALRLALGFSAAMGLGLLALVAVVSHELTASRIATATAVASTAVSAAIWLLVFNTASDVAYCVMGLGAVLLTLRQRRTAAIVVFMLAAMLRPEAALLALVPLVQTFVAKRKTPASDSAATREWVRVAATFTVGAVVAAGAWLAMGAAGGDLLVGLHSAASNAEVNNNARGLGAALTGVLPGLAGATGWLMVCAAAVSLTATSVAWSRDRHRSHSTSPSRGPRGGTSAQESDRQRSTLTVGVFIGIAAVTYLAQGLTGTPLVARYLLLPAVFCVTVAARCVPLAGRLSRNKHTSTVLSVIVAVTLVASAIAANIGPWRDVSAARHVRSDVFDSASQLLANDLPRNCDQPFVVRSPAVVALVALNLNRPLRDVTVSGSAGDGVLLQPLSLDAAQLAGYGPMTPLAQQAIFPTDAPPRQSNEHWALYSACQP